MTFLRPFPVFRYAVGNLAEVGFKVVGQDQLAGGPSPDNSASVSCLDWATGRPNAKYYSIQMLAAAFGVGTPGVDGVVKTLYDCIFSVILDHFSRASQPRTTPHTACTVLYLAAMFAGC